MVRVNPIILNLWSLPHKPVKCCGFSFHSSWSNFGASAKARVFANNNHWNVGIRLGGKR